MPRSSAAGYFTTKREFVLEVQRFIPPRLTLSFQDFQMGKADLQPFVAHRLEEDGCLLILTFSLDGANPPIPKFGVSDPHPHFERKEPFRGNYDLLMEGDRTLL